MLEQVLAGLTSQDEASNKTVCLFTSEIPSAPPRAARLAATRAKRPSYAATRTNSKLNGMTSKFGWLQAPRNQNSFFAKHFREPRNHANLTSQGAKQGAMNVCLRSTVASSRATVLTFVVSSSELPLR